MADGLNLRELLLGDPVRIRYVTRFSTCHIIHRESVAEHSYYVALYAMFIRDWVHSQTSYQISPDIGNLLRRAILHDLEECVTGDVSRSFKYSTVELRKALGIGAFDAFTSMMRKLDLPEKQWINYEYEWQAAKNGTWEGKIIEFADYLSVLSYMVQEKTNSNNSMQVHWETMEEYAANFEHSRFDFLRPLIDDAKQILEEAFVGPKP